MPGFLDSVLPSGLHPLDVATIVAYLAVILGIGVYFRKNESRQEFFVAGRSMGWFAVGLSVMATLFSSNSFVFYPAAAFGDSLRIGLSLVAFALTLPLMIGVFIPVYARLNVETAYEYLERRFHVSVRTLASGLFILLRIGWMASATYSASLVVSSVANVPQVTVIVGIGVIAIGYTLLGGIRAVMWTDVLQFLVFTTTILLVLGCVVVQTGYGPGELIDRYFLGRDNVLVDFTPSMTLPYGSWAILIGVFLEALSAYAADQVAVQRYLSAKSERTSQIAAIVNVVGSWIVVPGLLLIGVGLYSYYTRHPEGLGEGSLTEILAADPKVADTALPRFAATHLPAGVLGLFLAALLAAIMSSIDSGIHSVTTAIIVDFRDRLFPRMKPQDARQEVWPIRLVLLVVGTLSVTLACFVGPLGNVFDVGKKLTSAFGGPLLAMFVLALFSRRTTSFGVLVGSLVSACGTLFLMRQFPDWFSVWYWPIGFSSTLVLSLVLSILQRPPADPLTWFAVRRLPASRESS